MNTIEIQGATVAAAVDRALTVLGPDTLVVQLAALSTARTLLEARARDLGIHQRTIDEVAKVGRTIAVNVLRGDGLKVIVP